MNDKELGLQRAITRRDFVNGVAVAISGSLAWRWSGAQGPGPVYPPALTGMRGSHDGSYEVAHQLAREGRTNWGPATEPDDGIYDLVVVGAGVSGLSAAYFYQQARPDARILIIDNHDDFGGHAKRNEFTAGGRTLLTHGGSEILEGPGGYKAIAKSLFDELGISVEKLGAGFDLDFYSRNNLAPGTYFDQKTFGADRTIPYSLTNRNHYQGWIPVADSPLSHEEAVAQMPMSRAAREELLRLITIRENLLPDDLTQDEDDYLNSISYRDFLERHAGISEPEVFAAFENLTTDWCVGIEAVPALEAFYWGLPGINATSRAEDPEALDEWLGLNFDPEPAYHFPDGNASIARMLVRHMIPDVAPGQSIDDLVLAAFDYGMLDQPDSKVRVRLLSTAVNVRHEGTADSAERVQITYSRNGETQKVHASHCILACYNQIIPSLCPEMPADQRAALKTMVKSPILYTNVAVRNWHAWKELGVGAVQCPGSYFVTAHLDYPVDFGGYEFPRDPAEPAVVHMVRFPHMSGAGLPPAEQKRLSRFELLTTSFETIERNVRDQLNGILKDGGFDAARDVAAITANRWSHAYINRANPLYDDVYEDWNDERYAFVQGRQRFGRVAIANSDAGSISLIDTAIEQGYRAVSELL